MFRAPLCPSSGSHDDSIGYHIGRLVLELLLVGSYVQAGWMSAWTEGCNTSYCWLEVKCRQDGYVSGHSSILPALNFQPEGNREPDGLCGNQRYRRELLMKGIMVPETR